MLHSLFATRVTTVIGPIGVLREMKPVHSDSPRRLFLLIVLLVNLPLMMLVCAIAASVFSIVATAAPASASAARYTATVAGGAGHDERPHDAQHPSKPAKLDR
jgi:hypothetical protein